MSSNFESFLFGWKSGVEVYFSFINRQTKKEVIKILCPNAVFQKNIKRLIWSGEDCGTEPASLFHFVSCLLRLSACR